MKKWTQNMSGNVGVKENNQEPRKMSWSELEYEGTGWVGLASLEKARTQGRPFAEILQGLVIVISQKSEDEDHTIEKFSNFLYIMACIYHG